MKKTSAILISICVIITLFAIEPDKFENENQISKEEIVEAVKTVQQDSVASKTDYENFIEKMRKEEGLFTFYHDDIEGKVYLEILPKQFNQEFICTITRETGDGYYYDASAALWNFVYSFKQVNKNVQMIEKNLNFRADKPEVVRALENSLSYSIIASGKQMCKPGSDGQILVDAADFFLRDVANVGTYSTQLKTNFSLDKSNSYFSDVKTFPLNSELEITLHFTRKKGNYVFTLANGQSMIHKYHYSLIPLMENDYRPRKADDRIGLFTTIYQDYNSLELQDPYVRYVNRWNLKKKHPHKKMSEPVEPITFWLENTIPVEYRKAVKKGILLWNEAYEAIGFKNAIVVKQMPDDADWDPADARYNTIRWIIQPGSGYAVGPSHVNPYTGQIYDADVRISGEFIRYFYREYDEALRADGLYLKLDEVDLSQTQGRYQNNYEVITQAQWMGTQLGYASAVLNSRGIFKKGLMNQEDFIDKGIIDLVCHEVGHTLGMRHNFKASTIYTAEQLQDKEFTKKNGLIASIMDYTPVNIAAPGKEQGSFFQGRVGVWDKWVIEYGYSEFKANEEDEKLEEIASRCADPQLDYGTDEDAYGYSSRSVDPLCNMFDLGRDPLEFSRDQLAVSKEIWSSMDEYETDAESYYELMHFFSQGFFGYFTTARLSSKFVGGLYAHRDHINDPDGRLPYEVVPAAKQIEALDLIITEILPAGIFYFDPEILNKMVYDKNPKFTGGFWGKERQDYPIHAAVRGVYNSVINRLYDPLVLQRVCDNEVKFQSDEKFTISLLFDKMSSALWQELDNGLNVNSYRRDLQRIYLNKMFQIMANKNNKYPGDAIALARFEIKNIHVKIDQLDKSDLDLVTQAHLAQMKAEIIEILDLDY